MLLKIPALACLLALTLLCTPAQAQRPSATRQQVVYEEKPHQMIQSFYNTLLQTMKDGPALGFEGRFKVLERAIQRSFNIPFMTRYAMGPAWEEASTAERQDAVKAFQDFSIATYASRFASFDDEVFTVHDIPKEKPDDAEESEESEKAEKYEEYDNIVLVKTTLQPSGEDVEAVNLHYLTRKDSSGTWRIVDIYLDGTISELGMRRAEFTALAKQSGIRSVTRSLQEKTALMRKEQTAVKPQAKP
ncbi:MAG: ABC transporter substrate-binding protein [Alphaproteobacteria bacterium]|nr:ABC transporter substrate-binding protein [Alphaproteobacteria bacterium]